MSVSSLLTPTQIARIRPQVPFPDHLLRGHDRRVLTSIILLINRGVRPHHPLPSFRPHTTLADASSAETARAFGQTFAAVAGEAGASERLIVVTVRSSREWI